MAIQLKRGNKENFTETLLPGEAAFLLDEGRLFIGNGNTNLEIGGTDLVISEDEIDLSELNSRQLNRFVWSDNDSIHYVSGHIAGNIIGVLTNLETINNKTVATIRTFGKVWVRDASGTSISKGLTIFINSDGNLIKTQSSPFFVVLDSKEDPNYRGFLNLIDFYPPYNK